MAKLRTPIIGIRLLFTAYYQAEGPLLFGCQLQLNSNLGSHFAGTGLANYSLILSRGSFFRTGFPKLWVPAGTRANHAAVDRVAFLPASPLYNWT